EAPGLEIALEVGKLERNEHHAHVQRASQVVGERDVVADKLAGIVDVGERQRRGVVAHAQGAALLDARDVGAALSRRDRRLRLRAAEHGGLDAAGHGRIERHCAIADAGGPQEIAMDAVTGPRLRVASMTNGSAATESVVTAAIASAARSSTMTSR